MLWLETEGIYSYILHKALRSPFLCELNGAAVVIFILINLIYMVEHKIMEPCAQVHYLSKHIFRENENSAIKNISCLLMWYKLANPSIIYNKPFTHLFGKNIYLFFFVNESIFLAQ